MAQARQLLLDAIRQGAGEDVPVKGVVEVAREVSEGLVSAAETQEASLIVVGHSELREEDEAAGKRFDRVMHQVARNSEADLVVAKFRRDRVRSILLPINTGLNLRVSGMLAGAICRAKSAPVTLIHLLREDETEEQARERLEALLAEQEMEDLGDLVIEQPPEGVDPLDRMLEIANGHDVAIVGAEPRPSIAESIFGSWAERIATQAECTVLLVRAKSADGD